MLRHLIRREMLDQALSLRFAILASVGALVIWLSLFSGYGYYRDSLETYRLTQQQTDRNIQHLMALNSRGIAGQNGYPVPKPVSPLCIVSRGLEPTLGQTAYISFRDIERAKFSPVADEPILGVFPPLDLGAVVRVVLSLFVLLLTYDAVCGEKERGTLRLTASFPAPRAYLVLAKTVGALFSALAAFGAPLFLGLAVVFALPDVQFSGAELVRLGLLLAAFVVYLAVFACAGVLGSCLTHRSATAFVLLLVFWVGAIVVLPRLSLIIGDLFRPAPSNQQLQADLREIGNRANQVRFGRQQAWEEAFFKRTGRRWWESPEGQEGRAHMRDEYRKEAQAAFQPESEHLQNAFHNRYEARLDLAVLLARLSPAFALKYASVRLAGTGMARHERFLEAVHAARVRHVDWYWQEVVREGEVRAHPEKYGAYRMSQIPRMTYRDAWPAEDVRAALFDVGLLGIWGLVFFAGAYVAMLRYDLR